MEQSKKEKQWLGIYQYNIPTRTVPINTKVKRRIEMERKRMIRNLKTRTTMLQALQVHTLEILQRLNIVPLLA